jgi:hypothetical protein
MRGRVFAIRGRDSVLSNAFRAIVFWNGVRGRACSLAAPGAACRRPLQTGGGCMTRWRMRSAVAFGIVVVGVLGIAGVDRAIEQDGWAACFPELQGNTASQGDSVAEFAAGEDTGKDGISLRYGLSDGFPLALFSCLAEAPDASNGLSAEFEEEVASLSFMSNPRATSLRSGGIVGVVCDGSREGIEQDLLRQLEANGWYEVDLDADSRFSGHIETDADLSGFVLLKDDGRYRWLHVSCTDSGNRTSIVFVFNEEGDSGCRG